MPEWREKRMPVDGTAAVALAKIAPPAKPAGKGIVAAR
jgi:hypothetical protein